MRVLIAFDKFKDSMSAEQACRAAAAALAAVRPDWAIDACPLTDGGDGFIAVLTRAGGGERVAVTVAGPRGDPVTTGFGLVREELLPAGIRPFLPAAVFTGAPFAVVEMASASGLALLPPERRDPELATSLGTGELLRAAAARRPAAIFLGVGGSATHDLGLGALEALGLRCVGADGRVLERISPDRWPLVQAMAGDPGRAFPPLFIACDVDNPLLGPHGALATYGPQKGLQPGHAARMEAGTGRLARLLCRHAGREEGLLSIPGAGAAGGIAFGLMAALGASLLPGTAFVSAWLDLESRIAAADLVITGEGRFDDSSLSGKGPGSLARQAIGQGKAVEVFAGQVTVSHPIAGVGLHAVAPAHLPLAAALAQGESLLGDSVRRVFAGR